MTSLPLIDEPTPRLRTWSDAAELPSMILLPDGEFVMGATPRDRFAHETERPPHLVRIAAGLSLSQTPITVAQFRLFNSTTATDQPGDLPATSVTWHQALAYCDWLTLQTGRFYRLPSEAEWEFACRAGSRTLFAFGDTLSTAEANFYYAEDSRRIGLGHPTPVGRYPANAFGLQDLHGNVCEWVADNWHPNYEGAPRDGSAWVDPESLQRVVRGGAWDYMPRLLRSAWRDWHPETYAADNLGFRIATDQSPAFG